MKCKKVVRNKYEYILIPSNSTGRTLNDLGSNGYRYVTKIGDTILMERKDWVEDKIESLPDDILKTSRSFPKPISRNG